MDRQAESRIFGPRHAHSKNKPFSNKTACKKGRNDFFKMKKKGGGEGEKKGGLIQH